MKISFTTLILAGALSALMGTTASADMTAYTQLKDSVTSQLSQMGVDTSELGKLTTMQLQQLTSTLTGKEPDGQKAMNADFMIQEFLHPMETPVDSPEGKALTDQLAQKLKEIDVAYPTAPLTSTQVQALLTIIANKTHYHVNVKQAVEALVAMSTRGDTPNQSDPAVMQQEEEVTNKLVQFGLTPPPKGTLTFEQLGKLEGIISTSDTEAEMKADAAKVLSGN